MVINQKKITHTHTHINTWILIGTFVISLLISPNLLNFKSQDNNSMEKFSKDNVIPKKMEIDQGLTMEQWKDNTFNLATPSNIGMIEYTNSIAIPNCLCIKASVSPIYIVLGGGLIILGIVLLIMRLKKTK